MKTSLCACFHMVSPLGPACVSNASAHYWSCDGCMA